MLKLKSKAISLVLFLCGISTYAAQNKTYPTAATTEIRWNTYMDAIEGIANSTWTIQSGTWTILNSSPTAYWVNPQFVNVRIGSALAHIWVATANPVNLWTWDYAASTYTYTPMAIDKYTQMVVRETKNQDIFNIVNNMEEYMVWPSTTTAPLDWKGWCLSYVNGNRVPVVCP